MTHSYFYHPKFLLLDVGGGPIFSLGRAQDDATGNRSREFLYNFSVRATVLADKPARGTVFYEHLNPTISLSPGETFNQQTTRYGLTFALLAPVTPVPFNVEATRSQNKGSSTQRIIEDQIDRFTLNGYRSLWNFGMTQFSYHAQQQESANGSPGLPIQHSRLHSQSINADTRLQLGRDRQYDLYNNITYTTQKYTLEQAHTPEIENFRFLLNFQGKHTGNLRTTANYNFSRDRQDERATTVNAANAVITWSAERDLVLSAGLHAKAERCLSASRAANLTGIYVLSIADSRHIVLTA